MGGGKTESIERNPATSVVLSKLKDEEMIIGVVDVGAVGVGCQSDRAG